MGARVRLVLDASYPNRMSYLDEWRAAWLRQKDSPTHYLNVASPSDLISSRKKVRTAEQIVILHSCLADTNNWLKPLISQLTNRRGDLILFIGNEYSSPTVSMDERMRIIGEINPEILASQLPLDSAQWLYEGKAQNILSAPQGMPEPIKEVSKELDFSYRGFKYPSFILGNTRNEIAEQVRQHFFGRGLKTDFSLTERLQKNEWMSLLAKTRITAASQAGSSRVFRSDEVWNSLRTNPNIKLLDSDNLLIHSARYLPHSLKMRVRRRIVKGKTVFGSLHDDSNTSILLHNQVSNSHLPSTDGRAISSRHFDAIAAGTWQILESGYYNGLLEPWIDYTPLDSTEFRDIERSIDHALENSTPLRLIELQERLYEANSYDHRIRSILEKLS